MLHHQHPLAHTHAHDTSTAMLFASLPDCLPAACCCSCSRCTFACASSKSCCILGAIGNVNGVHYFDVYLCCWQHGRQHIHLHTHTHMHTHVGNAICICISIAFCIVCFAVAVVFVVTVVVIVAVAVAVGYLSPHTAAFAFGVSVFAMRIRFSLTHFRLPVAGCQLLAASCQLRSA